MAAGKRKRGDRTHSNDSTNDPSSRPSPHRPSTSALGQQSREQEQRWRGGGGDRGGGRRQGRGGRGGAGQGQRQDPANPRSPTNAHSSPPPMNKASPVTQSTVVPASQPSSKPSEPPKAIPQQSVSSTQEEPPPDLRPYDWEYLHDDVVGSWKEKGQKTVVDIGVQAQMDEDPVALGSMFQELLRAGLNGRIPSKDAGTTIKELFERESRPEDEQLDEGRPTSSFDSRLLFLDTLSVLTEFDISNPRLPTLVLSTEVPALLMRHHLDAPLLEKIGLIRNTFSRVGIRKTTNLLYRQSNYNLLREESEGYAKLITELFTTSNNQPPTSDVVEETFERVRALVGAFDLDVGRVLDVTLDVFASVLVKQFRFFVKLLRASSWWPQSSHFEGIETTRIGFDSLPSWALPGSTTWQSNEEDRSAVMEARTRRDYAFWDEVRARGMAAFFELGGRRATSTQFKDSATPQGIQNNDDEGSDRTWIEATGCLPPQGNRVAAQLLGFKLRFYASDARDTSDVLPANLIYLAALLIKIGFISLRDLYPHLWPLDEGMEALREQKMKEKAEREKLNRPGGGVANALMLAGALPDEPEPGSNRFRDLGGNRGTPARKVDEPADKTQASVPAEEKETASEPAEQKVQLLKSLLCIGALPEALYIIGRFPWIPDAFPDVPEYIHRILHHCLSKVYEPARPLSDRNSLREPRKTSDPDQTGVAKGHVRLLGSPPRRVLRWPLPDKEDTSDSTDFRFYWDDWNDNIPVCQTVDDMFTLCGTLLNLSGVKIGKDSTLLIKLARIGRKSLNDDPSQSNLSRWIDLSKRLLVPSLSLTKSNPGVVNEVYDLIKTFSTSARYSIYGEWFLGSTSRLPDIQSAFNQAQAETKDILKRMSKNNVKSSARLLAKVAYASPGMVFKVAIAQIESYDNLVEVIVECARYFTLLGYDVLTWSLTNALGNQGRNRVQSDGMLTSKWLSALSLFAGRLFKRYSLMSPAPVLQYVSDQLRQGNSTDLIVLKEITTAMAGIIPDTNFNDAQILAMAGGELLRAQTLLQLFDKRHECRNTSKRLIRALVEPKLAGQLLVAIAQARQTCIFSLPEPDSHLKILSTLFDEVHLALAQYLDLLRSNLSVKEFDQLVPDVSELIMEYGIEANVAFWISRPSIAAVLSDASTTPNLDSPRPQAIDESKKMVTGADADGDIKMESGKPENTPDAESKIEDVSATDQNGVIEVSNTDADVQEKLNVLDVIAPAAPKETPDPWSPATRNLMERLRPTLPDEAWSQISLSFYVAFWQLSLYDIQVPSKSYEEEVARLKHKWMQVRDDRSDMSIAGSAKKEKEKRHISETQDRLRDELKAHIQAFSQTKARVLKEKGYWFDGFWGKWDVLNDGLFQYCLLPRLMISAPDAIFCFKMIKLLHSTGTPNFRTAGLLDHMFRQSRLANIIFTCTSREAENFGRFLNETLKDLSRWHADKAVFEKEAYGVKKDLPGFARKLVKDQAPESLFDYEDFRRILLKWHRNLNGALKSCLTGGEHMHIRNAIIVLKAIQEYFPAVNWIGKAQVSCLADLSQKETRTDLKISATSLMGNLKKRESGWFLPQAFNLAVSTTKPSAATNSEMSKAETPQNASNGGRSESAKPDTPQQQSEGKSSKPLSATAPEYQPKSLPIANGSTNASDQRSKADSEDGEIDDAKTQDLTMITEQPETIHKKQEGGIPGQKTALGDEAVPADSNTKVSSLAAVAQDESRASRTSTPRASSQPRESKTLPEKPLAANTRADHGNRVDSNKGGHPPPGPIRTQHDLPNRPDLTRSEPYPRNHDRREADRLEFRDVRSQRQTDAARTDRLGDRARDHVPDRRPDPPPQYRGHERSSIRPTPGDRREPDFAVGREAPARNAPEDRYESYNDRSARDRGLPPDPPNGGRAGNYPRPLSRDEAMPPPRGSAQPHASRAPFIEGDPNRRSTPSRQERDGWKGRSSRPQSPRPAEDWAGAGQYGYESRRDERPRTNERSTPNDLGVAQPPRADEARPPSGPRGDRSSRSSALEPPPPESDRSRELFNAIQPHPRAQEFDYEHDSDYRSGSRQQDPNYGRLNSAPDIPSGPRRNQGGRGGRLPPQHSSSRPTEMSAPSPVNASQPPERPPPTGPSSSRSHPRPGLTQFEQPGHGPPTGPASAPKTPVEAPVPSDLDGMHPDRLKEFKEMQPSPNRSNITKAPIPSADSSTIRGQAAPPLAPSGDRRGSQQSPPSPTGPASNNPRSAPTGPAAAQDRSRDKRFAGIQDLLQQSGTPPGPEKSDRGTSIRGRGGRSSGAHNAHLSSEPTTPVPGRSDPLASRVTAAPPADIPDTNERPYTRSGRSYEGAREPETRRSGRRRSSRPDDVPERDAARREDERYLSNRDEYREEYRDHRAVGPNGGPPTNGAEVPRNDRDLRRSGGNDRDDAMRPERGGRARDANGRRGAPRERDLLDDPEGPPRSWGGGATGPPRVDSRPHGTSSNSNRHARDREPSSSARREGRKRGRGGDDLLDGRGGGGHGDKRPRRIL
ncbi:MAG: homoserine O- acetyltransferase [Chaenotheca gracillima]|nr:MAG: homoserine O- acetyltransferase [Chaenotheca gracillima]